MKGYHEPSKSFLTLRHPEELASKGLIATVTALILAALVVNPLVERLQYSNPISFMFAHYALFGAGLVVGLVFLKANRWLTVPGVAIAVFWHLPVPFSLSASLFAYRVVEETTLVVSGLLVGASLVNMGWRAKGTLLALWVVADNVLSIIFIVSPYAYSSEGLNISPYGLQQFPLLGLTMILLMNSLVAIIVFVYMKRLASQLSSVKGRTG